METVMKVMMKESYSNLKLYFSSQNCGANCNLSHLVIFAEHAVKNNNPDIATDCLRMYFGFNPPCNQFYVRAHLCEAILTAPTSMVNKTGVTQSLNSIIKAIDVARESECYHFLIYNASVLLWQICRPYQHPGVCHLYAKPLQSVVRALDECKHQDWEWKLELLIGLIHSQMDAGCKEDAAQSCLSAIHLARKRIPSKLLDVLKIQMYYNLGEIKKDIVLSSECSALCQLYKTKGIIHQQDLTGMELDQKLRKVLMIITGVGGLSPPILTDPDDTRVPLLIELGMLCVEYHLTGLAQECLVAVGTAKISDPRLTLMKESVTYQLSIRGHDQAEKVYNNNTVDVRLKALSRVANLLTALKKIQDFDLIQYICVVLWNLSVPLLQQNSHHQLLKPMNVMANILKESSSTLFQLRANLHFEIAKISVTNMDLRSGLKHVKEAMVLDMFGEHCERLKIFRKQLTLRAQLYDVPNNFLDQAITLIKQASVVHSIEKLQPLLVKAGELLAPNCFTDVLQKQRARDSRHYKHQINEFITTTGNENDKERCLLLAEMVKIAHKNHIWDVAFVACQLCLCYDDGRWKASKPVISSPHHQQYSSSLENGSATFSHSGGGENHTCFGKFTIEMIRLLAEIHCIFAKCLMNQLQQAVRPFYPSPSFFAYDSVDQSIKHNQKTFMEWASVVSDDVSNALLRAAELGCALGEQWLVYNAASCLWNYHHDWLEINKGNLIKVCRQLLPIIKQVDLGSDSVLGILVCTALSDGLIDKWTHTKPESIFRAGTAGKKSGQQATKKGKDVHNSEQLHIDPEGCLEIKEALEVCQHAMTAYSEVSLVRRRKLLITYVKCKLLLQQSIPTKTFGVVESMDHYLNCRAIIAVEMSDLVSNKGLDFPNCPTLYEILSLLTDCKWRDTQIEMELWTRLATIALKENDYELVCLCCKSVAKVHAKLSQKPESTVKELLLSMTNYLNGQGLLATAAGNVAIIRKVLDSFLDSARFGCSSGSYCLVMKACYQYWNACLPLATSSFGRGLLCDPMLKLLSLVATFIRRRKETVFEPHEHSFSLEQDHNTLKAMYGLVFQVFADKHCWDLGLQAVEEAMLIMPKEIIHHLFKHKLMFKSKMGKNVEGDILKFSFTNQEESKDLVASLWYQTASYAGNQTEGLKSYRNAIQLLQSDNYSWQKVEYLVEFSEWLHQHQFAPEVSLDHLQNVVDIMLGVDSSTASIMNIHQLEALMRVHVMMSQLHGKGSCSREQLGIVALGFCFQMWKLMYDTAVSSGIIGPILPRTVVEWASFQAPQQLVDRMKTESYTIDRNTSFVKKPMLSLHYLGILAKSLAEMELEALAIPVLHLQFVIANALVKDSEPLCKLIHMRLATLCIELGVASVAVDHSDKLHKLVLSPQDLTRSHMEIQQFKAKKRVVERTVSKYGVSSKSEHSLIKMQSMLSGKNLPAKYMYENVIKDGVVLREVCVQQAIILISQGEHQDAHELLNHALTSCQIIADSGTLFQVFCGLVILSLNESVKPKSVQYLLAAQNMPCNLEQWIDGNLLLSDYLTTGEDKLNSSLFEFVILFARSLREELMNNVIVEYGTAILTCRLNLLKQKNALSHCSEEISTLFQTQLLQYCEVVTEAGNCLLKQDCYIETARILSQQAKYYRIMAEGCPLDVQNCQKYFLLALKLYEKSITLLYDVYESVRFLCQPSKMINLTIQREVLHAQLGSAEVMLAVFEKYYSDLILPSKHVIEGYVSEVSMLSLIEEEWKATAMSAIEKTLGCVSAAYLFAQGNILLKTKCTYGLGCCFYLLARHASPDWQFQWREQTCKEPKFDECSIMLKNKEDHCNVEISEALSVHHLLQACNSLSEVLFLALKCCIWTLGAITTLKIMDCCGVFDPATSSLYLTFYQNLVTSVKLKKVLKTVHSHPSTSQLHALLEQNDNFSENNFWPALQANTNKLRTYEVFQRLQIAENHIELLKIFPANFRFVLLQHSLDRSRLFTAYLIPPQPQLPVTKKGQPLEQTESLEPIISFADVSSKDYKHLQNLIEDYHASICMSRNNCDSLKGPGGMFSSVLSEMEQYFAVALKNITNVLSSENGDKDLNVVILGDNDLLALPLESMAIFQQTHITSVSRDFSLQMFYYRILMFNNNINEEVSVANTKDKKKIDKQQPQCTTLVADASQFKYIVDPKNDSALYVELHDAVGSLINVMQSCTRVASKWSGYSSPESKLSLSEWSVLLKNASGILYFGTERLLAHYPAALLTTLNLQKCHVMLVMDGMQSSSKDPYKRKSAIESHTVMLLSLAGAGCIVTNQSFASIKSNSNNINTFVQGLMLDGSTTGGVNWSRLRNKHAQVDHQSIERYREILDCDIGTSHVQRKACEEERDCNTFTVVYGLPHIVLTK